MPDTKISALTAGNPALSTDAIPIARSGANFQLTAASVANLLTRAASITASGTPVVLTVTSAPQSFVSGSGGQVIQLPNATTLTVGSTFRFDNNQSSGAITVNNNSGTLVVSVPSGGFVVVTLLTNGTAAGTWDRHDLAPSNVSWSTNTFDYPGSITSATWNGVTVATNRGGTGLASFTSGGAVYATSTSALTTGTLPTASGGTNLTSFTTNGAVYATSTSALTTGTLPIASGGTSATTKAAAFNALSPIIATGDLILGNGANSQRLAIGSFNQYLRSNGTTASWANVSVSASDIAGTLQPFQGGTGTSSSPMSNGQLLIGNGFGGYNVNTLTAGAGVTITNGSGTVTIAASGGGGGPTINIMSVSTSSGSFNNSPPSSSSSKPLAASATSPSNIGAFVFANGASGFNISGVIVNSIGIQDSTSTFTTFSSGPDFSGSPSSFEVNDRIVSCYGLFISNTSMFALFTNTRAAMTDPNLAPFVANFGSSSDNPNINVSTSSGTFFKSSSGGIVVDKSTPSYIIYFGTGSPSASGSVTVNSMSIEAGGTSTFPTTYFDGSDFFTSFAENTANGMFQMQISVANPTLQTLLDNSFRT